MKIPAEYITTRLITARAMYVLVVPDESSHGEQANVKMQPIMLLIIATPTSDSRVSSLYVSITYSMARLLDDENMYPMNARPT